MSKISIIGTASWGTTLGVALARKEMQVKLWTRTEEEAQQLNQNRRNSAYLPEIPFPQHLSATHILKEALEGTDLVIWAVPAQRLRQSVRLAQEHLESSMFLLSAAKGLELGSLKRMSEVIADEVDPSFHDNIFALSGPNLSREIARGLPAAAVVAALNGAVAEEVQRLLLMPNFCVFISTDIVGVELGGALKNVIALGAGIADGLGLGDNARAALITRGLAEITSLGVALGANPLTFSGLSGLGDLITTCSSPLSRNHFVGAELARGRSLDEIKSRMHSIAEGVDTTIAARQLAQLVGVQMPITEEVYAVLFEGFDPRQFVADLMGRGVRHELAGI